LPKRRSVAFLLCLPAAEDLQSKSSAGPKAEICPEGSNTSSYKISFEGCFSYGCRQTKAAIFLEEICLPSSS